jgi:hypothetical protein
LEKERRASKMHSSKLIAESSKVIGERLKCWDARKPGSLEAA